MHPLVIGIVATVSLIIILSIVYSLIKNLGNLRHRAEWFNRHGKRVVATVVQVEAGQGWKYEEKWERDAWEGWQRKKSWQTYYNVTAQWENPRTKRKYTFQCQAWAGDIARKPGEGDTITVIVNPHNLRHYIMDVHTF
jgi:hypothetical protein